MFNKFKKKEQKELTPFDIITKNYLDNLSEYIRFNEKYFKSYDLEGSEDREQQLTNEYNAAINELVNYLYSKFPDSIFNSNCPVEINIPDMCENISNFTFNMLKIPKYPAIIDIDRDEYSTHFHTVGDKVVEAENVQVLPGILPSLRNSKINKIFEGRTIKETRDLLKQMRILPITNDLDKVIVAYDERNRIYKGFLRSVIYSLLSKARTPQDIQRARLFADSFELDFDFKPFDSLVTQNPKLKLN